MTGLKLRSMVVGEKKDMVYIASEETAIRAMDRMPKISGSRRQENRYRNSKEDVLLGHCLTTLS